jgi:hypothetical protein
MNGRSFLIISMLLVSSRGAEARGSRVEPVEPVTVRVYRSAGDPVPFARVSDDASRLFRSSGIAVAWVDCATMPSPCRRSLGASERVLRLSAAIDGTAVSQTRSLGFAFVNANHRTSRLATVYPERVALLARLAGVDESTLLARAMAHEIGHLLIQSSQHAPLGLMRALWTVAELRRNWPRDWSFSDRETQAMRRTLESGRDDTTTPRMVRNDADDLCLCH